MLADLEVGEEAARARSPRTPSAATRRRWPRTRCSARSRPALDAGKPALTVDADAGGEARSSTPFFLLTDKPTIFACNVKEADLATADANPYVMKVREYVKTHLACEAVVISAQIESDLIDLAPDEADGVPEGARRRGKRHRRADPRDLSPARPADLFHGRREGSARLDDPRGRHRAEGGGRDPLRLRARLHQGRNRGLRRSGRSAARSPRRARRGSTAWKARSTSSKDGDVLLFKFNV